MSPANSVEIKDPTIEHHEDLAAFTPAETRKLLRKLDLTILPLVSVMYLLSFLDRSNIGNARLAGLEKDLGMTGWDYAVSNPLLSSFWLYLILRTYTYYYRERSDRGFRLFPFLHSL